MPELIKCSCGKKFPFNPRKHQNKKTLCCPFCGVEHPNPKFDSTWVPNPEWRSGETGSKPFTITDMRRAIQKGVKGIRQRQLIRNTEMDAPSVEMEETISSTEKPDPPN